VLEPKKALKCRGRRRRGEGDEEEGRGNVPAVFFSHFGKVRKGDEWN
jgi:hypothetical protein